MVRRPKIDTVGLIPHWDRVRELIRFYQAALLNTAFGIGTYMLLVALGVNMYAAQAIAHVLGMAFNYVTYSRHVFRDSKPAKSRFIASYGLHYLLGLGALAGISQFIANPYIAGIGASLVVSVINYFVLRNLVFKARKA